MSETGTTAEKPKRKTPLELAVERIIEKSKTASPKEKLKTFQDAGILDENGQLTKPYIGIDKVINRAS